MQSGVDFDDDGGMQGEVSPESMGKTASSADGESAQRESGHFRNYWKHCGTKSAKALHRKAVQVIERAGMKSQKGIPAITLSLVT